MILGVGTIQKGPDDDCSRTGVLGGGDHEDERSALVKPKGGYD